MGQARCLQNLRHRINRFSVVVSASATTAQNKVAIRIAGGGNNGRVALAIDAEKVVRARSRLHRIDGHGDPPVGAVLEADGHGQTRRHLPVGLAFSGARSNGGPAHQISDVLRHDRIEQFSGCWQTTFSQMQQQAPCPAQTGVDVVAAIQLRVIDQPLPTDCGARLFEVNAHHHLKAVLEPLSHHGQSAGVLLGSGNVMHRTGANDHQKTVILSSQEALDALPGLPHRLDGQIGERQIAVQDGRRHQRPGLHHVQIGGGEHGVRGIALHSLRADPGRADNGQSLPLPQTSR